MNLVLNHTKIDKNKIYYTSKNPKISIVITVYNVEAYVIYKIKKNIIIKRKIYNGYGCR